MRQVSFFNVLSRSVEVPDFVAGQEVGCYLLGQDGAQLGPDCGGGAGGGGFPPAGREALAVHVIVATARLRATAGGGRLQEGGGEVGRLAGPGGYWLR